MMLIKFTSTSSETALKVNAKEHFWWEVNIGNGNY